MHPKRAQKIQMDTAKATVVSIDELQKIVATLVKKIDALGRMMKEQKVGRVNKS